MSESPEEADAHDSGDASGKLPFESVGEFVSIFKRGRTWYANYQLEGRQRRKSLKTGNPKEARRRALRLEVEIASGCHKERTEVATIAEAVVAYKEFLRTEKRAPRTIEKYDMVLDRVVALAAKRKAATLDRLNLAFVDQYRSGRVKAGRADKTVYGETVIIRQLVNFALKRDLVFHDPLKGLSLKKPKSAPQPCWTFEEVTRILTAVPDSIRAPLTLLAETGMRFGELAWLTWDDVGAAGLSIRPKDNWKPKTGDRRTIPISAVAATVLASLPRSGRWVATMPLTKRRPAKGQQWTERRLLIELQRVLKTLGLPGKLHTFRHYFISNALLKGIPTATVRSWVGQVDEEIIKLYTHIHDRASQAAMQRLSQANQEGLQPEDSKNGTNEAEIGSAQNQHKRKEAGNG
jgi:integrase